MALSIDAVAVVAKDLQKTLEFYQLLGFDLKHIGTEGDHYEATQANGLRLMIDSEKLLESLGQPKAEPATFANFALKAESPVELNEIILKIQASGFEIIMQPQDMFWGQRYSTIKDPNGNRIDLFAWL
jgi:uncharacterized glyoxalase superfamily protein PhnB